MGTYELREKKTWYSRKNMEYKCSNMWLYNVSLVKQNFSSAFKNDILNTNQINLFIADESKS